MADAAAERRDAAEPRSTHRRHRAALREQRDAAARAFASPPPPRPLWRKILRWAGLPPPLERWLRRRLPRRLFARSILIIVVPMIVLQSVVAFVFLDRHWQGMTVRLSQATAQEVGATVRLIETAAPEDRQAILDVAGDTLFDSARLSDRATLPALRSPAFFDLLERTLSEGIGREVAPRRFFVNTQESTRFVEVQVQTAVGVLDVVTRRSHTYASNSHITLVWMMVTSLILIAVSLLFLKGQVRPIQELAAAAERFGRGRPVGRLRPHGAIEVRQATWAFLEMKQRIERQIEQRTAMLAGVSHDLRTMLTRFRLELALLGDGPELASLTADVEQMQAMLEDYLMFARTDADEPADDVDIADLIEDACRGFEVVAEVPEGLHASVRPTATRRVVTNLVANAARYSASVSVLVSADGPWLTIAVDDDGPGISPEERQAVFRPFYRLDAARNQDNGGTGLGLTIARDLARRQGGDVTLSDSPLGGLRASVRLPK